jgi:hypothetical protein
VNDDALIAALLRPLGALTWGVADVLLAHSLVPGAPGPALAGVWLAGVATGWWFLQRIGED